jgi:hypothetical protein
MKKVISLFLAMVCAFSLVQTSYAAGEPTVIRKEKNRKIEVKGQNEDGDFPVNPEIPGESPVTGLPWEGMYLPMLVQIDNDKGGVGERAPWGASYADIVYETPLAAGGYTRISFLFSDLVPESVGPVRSARKTHAELREEWDAGFLYYGGQKVDGTDINDVFRKTGARKKGVLFEGTASASKPWKQFYNRVKDLASPHNVDANVKAMQGLIPTDFKAPSRPYLFTDDLPQTGEFAQNISIDQRNKSYSSSFTYDPENNVYLRSVDGEPYVDKANQEQLAFSNLIIQRTKLSFYEGDGDRPITVDVGSGNADIFIGGRYIPGYWMRTALDQRTMFFDQDGNELKLQRGKTFISIMDYSVAVTYTAE